MPITAPGRPIAKDRPPGPRHALPGWLAAFGLLLLTAACGGGPKAVSSPSASAPPRMAFVRCVRAHGVPSYPDPNSNGQEPPGTKQLFISNRRFQAASDTCHHLLPNGGHLAQTPQADAMTVAGAVRLAGCMRTHGYPTFPDPTIDAVGQPVFNVQAAGIAPHSPRILATLRRCVSLLHLAGLPQSSS